jgi:hypothetical protein
MITLTSITRSVAKWKCSQFITLNCSYSRLNLMEFPNYSFAVLTVVLSTNRRGSLLFHAIDAMQWLTVTALMNTITWLTLKTATTKSTARISNCWVHNNVQWCICNTLRTESNAWTCQIASWTPITGSLCKRSTPITCTKFLWNSPTAKSLQLWCFRRPFFCKFGFWEISRT